MGAWDWACVATSVRHSDPFLHFSYCPSGSRQQLAILKLIHHTHILNCWIYLQTPQCQ